jgi:5-methylcytosine-specific restriction endonuclease McrA
MPWRNDDAARKHTSTTYGPEYRRNAEVCKRRANGRCERCGQRASRLEADHIVPVSQGGGHGLTNLQALCPACHRAKTAREGSAGRKAAGSGDPQPRPSTQW